MYAIDDLFTRWAQATHDFLWNTFGITKGIIIATLLLLLAVTHYVVDRDKSLVVILLICIMCFLFSIRALKEHSLQIKGSYKVLNDKALLYRKSIFHTVFRLFVLLQIVFDFYYGFVLTKYLVLLWFYAETCLVQDREIPESRFQYNHGV